MTSLYPSVEPHASGRLDVGDGQRMYWEACGDPEGAPALVLHGGPGSGCTPRLRRLFDPEAYRIVLFDQRGCGRSTPNASAPDADLSVNTTEHLLADIERLRAHLGVEGWLVFGVSWGVTLGLAYAERFPERVRAMVLVGVTTTRRREIEWLYRGVAPLFPEAWARFQAGVPAADRDGDLVAAYARQLHDPDASVRERAAQNFHDWEAALLSADRGARPPVAWSDPDYRLARARIVTHYFRHGAWLEEGALLDGAATLGGIPGTLIHGRLDVSAPLETAWLLARAWPDVELVAVDGAGHAASDRGMTEAILSATDRFARRA